MNKIVLPLVAFGLFAAPTFIAAPSVGGFAKAEEVGIKVEGDHDRDRDRVRRDHDRDDVVVIKKKHRDHDDD
jgi:Ni/Co efflux regulator RcnB